jgi:NADH dehydrogenase (ubiquinone) Fe-S protein 6
MRGHGEVRNVRSWVHGDANQMRANAILTMTFGRSHRRRSSSPTVTLPASPTMLAARLSRTIGASSSSRATVAAVRWSSQSSSKAANSPASPTVTGPSHTPQPGHVIESQTPDAATPAEFQQSPNYPSVWSTGQNPKPNAMSGPRFEQTHIGLQPNPLSAMEMVHRDPIRLVDGRRATCDGGENFRVVAA